MSQSKNNLLPGEALIYERADGGTYAKYRDPPHNTKPRWIIGGDPDAVQKAQGCLWSYSDWQDMMRVAETNETMQKQMKKLLELYYLCKDGE